MRRAQEMKPITSLVSVDQPQKNAVAVRRPSVEGLIGKVHSVPLNRRDARVEAQRYGVFGDDICAAGAVNGAGKLSLTIRFPQIAPWTRVPGEERGEPIANAVGVNAQVIIWVKPLISGWS